LRDGFCPNAARNIARMQLHMCTLAMAVGAVALVIGCTQVGTNTANGASPPDGGDGTDSPSSQALDGGTTTTSLSCMGVLQCAGACPDANVDACVQACADRTSPKSQPVSTAFIQCLSKNACADADCVNAKCESELDACLADVSEQGTPVKDPAPAGAVPAALVGTWSSVGTSSGTVWTFEADGKTTTAFEIDTSMGTCTYKTSVTSSGVTTAGADSYVYHRSSGTQVFKKCGSTSSSVMGAVDLTYRYELGVYDDGQAKLTIYIVNDDGTVNPSGTELHH
jgi:hypothetical protein